MILIKIRVQHIILREWLNLRAFFSAVHLQKQQHLQILPQEAFNSNRNETIYQEV